MYHAPERVHHHSTRIGLHTSGAHLSFADYPRDRANGYRVQVLELPVAEEAALDVVARQRYHGPVFASIAFEEALPIADGAFEERSREDGVGAGEVSVSDGLDALQRLDLERLFVRREPLAGVVAVVLFGEIAHGVL